MQKMHSFNKCDEGAGGGEQKMEKRPKIELCSIFNFAKAKHRLHIILEMNQLIKM